MYRKHRDNKIKSKYSNVYISKVFNKYIMIITKTVHIKKKCIPSIIGRSFMRTESEEFHIEKCLVTIIKVFGIPIYRKIELIPPIKNHLPHFDNLNI